jgi:hypothetical protein
MGVQPWHTVDRFASRPLYEGGDGAVHQLRRGKHSRVVNSRVAWQTVCTPSSLVKKRSMYGDRRRHTSLLLSVVLHDSSLETSVVHLRYGSRAYCTHKHVATCTWVHALVCTSLDYNVDQYRQAIDDHSGNDQITTQTQSCASCNSYHEMFVPYPA